jgi:hypothetical protein
MLSRACAFKLLFLGGFFFCSSIVCFTCSCESNKFPMYPEISLAILETSLPAALASL